MFESFFRLFDPAYFRDLYPNQHKPDHYWYFLTKWGNPNRQWCETVLPYIISHPANCWSNLSFIIIAIAAIWLIPRIKNNNNKKEEDEQEESQKGLQGTIGRNFFLLFVPITFIMGLFSGIYHASNVYLTQILDFVGMFMFTGYILAGQKIRYDNLKNRLVLLKAVDSSSQSSTKKATRKTIQNEGEEKKPTKKRSSSSAGRGRSSSSSSSASSKKRSTSSRKTAGDIVARRTAELNNSNIHENSVERTVDPERKQLIDTIIFVSVWTLVHCLPFHFLYLQIPHPKLEIQQLILLNIVTALFVELYYVWPLESQVLQNCLLIDDNNNNNNNKKIKNNKSDEQKKFSLSFFVQSKYFLIALLFVAVAYVFQILDQKRIWCWPDDHRVFAQGHACWHWISALMCWAMFEFFKTRY